MPAGTLPPLQKTTIFFPLFFDSFIIFLSFFFVVVFIPFFPLRTAQCAFPRCFCSRTALPGPPLTHPPCRPSSSNNTPPPPRKHIDRHFPPRPPRIDVPLLSARRVGDSFDCPRTLHPTHHKEVPEPLPRAEAEAPAPLDFLEWPLFRRSCYLFLVVSTLCVCFLSC